MLYPLQVKTEIRSNNVVTEGESVTLTCDVDSNPPASVTWTKLGQRTLFISSERILNLPVVSRKDAGTYQCQGENNMGLSNPSTESLDVQCKVHRFFSFIFNQSLFQIIPHWLKCLRLRLISKPETNLH